MSTEPEARPEPSSTPAVTGPPSECEDKGANHEADQSSANDELSPEEQMALYEDSLKDSDWGHQPC